MAAKSKTLKNGLDRDVCYSQATPTTMAIQIKFLWMKGETVIARPPSINWSLGLYQGFDIPQYWQNFGKYLILLQSTTVKQVKLRRYFLSLSLSLKSNTQSLNFHLLLYHHFHVRTSFILFPRVTYHYKPSVAIKKQLNISFHHFYGKSLRQEVCHYKSQLLKDYIGQSKQ